MRECIICGSQMSDDAATCGTCGFSSRRWFLSRTHYQAWMEQTVIPSRKKWERRTEESLSKAEPELTEKSTEPDYQVNTEKQTVKRKPKKMFRGIIAVIVVLAVFSIGFISGAIYFYKPPITVNESEIPSQESSSQELSSQELSSQELPSQELTSQIVDLITGVPHPSETDNTLDWLSKHGFSYSKVLTGNGGYHVQIDSIDAYYTSRFWRIIWYNSDDYENIERQLEELKYHVSYTDVLDTQLITTYTKEGKPSIRLIYDTSNHNLRIIINQT